jgi:small-conductance mechanosensitive channel
MWNQLERLFGHLPPLAGNLILVGFAVVAGLLIKWILSFLFAYYARHEKGFSIFRSIIFRIGKPLNFLLPLLLLDFVLQFMRLDPPWSVALNKAVSILILIAFATVLIGVIKVIEDYFYHIYDLRKPDDLKERKIRTQLQFVRKLLIVIICILTVCAILLNFEHLRRIGAGLLTGVGIGGIIIGFAAQRSLGNLFAGLQIAFTQPIRIDDALVVEGEWGIVEEITLTYVVINLWDQRRLILPINYFIERPFQNWTRSSAELLGTVFFFLDYTAPIEALRKEFNRLLELTDLWDKRSSSLLVTNATENTMEVRALVSASDSGKTFELRCYIRENMISFIQKNYPECLPKTRSIIAGELNADHRTT